MAVQCYKHGDTLMKHKIPDENKNNIKIADKLFDGSVILCFVGIVCFAMLLAIMLILKG